MATYTEIYNLKVESSDLRNRITVAIAKASYDIINEDGGTANHTNRVTWANNSLLNASSMAEKFMWAVLQNTTIQANGEASSDSDIQFVVNGLVSDVDVLNALIQ